MKGQVNRKNDIAIMNVGRNIRKYRLLKNLSINKFSSLCGIEAKQIWNYERGKVDTNITTLYRIAEFLDIDVRLLFTPEEEDKALQDLD